MDRSALITDTGREVTPGPPARTPHPHPLIQRPATESLRRAPATPAAPDWPTWSQRFLPAPLRHLLADLGWWQDPTPLPPSIHLIQVLAVLKRYGWCQSLDFSVTGRMCIRGAQSLLEKTGHVTPASRERAIHYMQRSLAQAGVTMQFFAWNDLPDQDFSAVEQLLTTAAHLARKNGE